MKKGVLLAVVMLMIAGCAEDYASHGERLYMMSRNGTIPVVPAPLTTSNLSDFYDLPAQNQNANVSIEPPAP